MALRVTFAEQSTGIVTTPSGARALGGTSFQKAANFYEAIAIARGYLELHPTHETWIGSTVMSHRITAPAGLGFEAWLGKYEMTRNTNPVQLGMTFGEIIASLGWPDDCSAPLGRSPLSVILRYQPGTVDFHFDQGGRLHLVHRDEPENPVTILTS